MDFVVFSKKKGFRSDCIGFFCHKLGEDPQKKFFCPPIPMNFVVFSNAQTKKFKESLL